MHGGCDGDRPDGRRASGPPSGDAPAGPGRPGRRPRVGLDATDRTILDHAARLAAGPGWDSMTLVRSVGVTKQTILNRVRRLESLGAWPFGPPRRVRERAGRRLDEAGRALAAAHAEHARRFARSRAARLPGLRDEVESEALWRLVRAALGYRPQLGPFDRYLNATLRRAVGSVLRDRRLQGYRRDRAGMPRIVPFDIRDHDVAG
jgi:hypothetical protein